MLLPKELSKKKAHLELEITRLSIDQRKNDTTEIGVQKRIPLSKADYFSSYSVSPDQEKDNSKIILSTNKNPTTDLWSVSLTSESWPTSHYRIALKTTQNDSVLHKRVIQSYWKNMPTPLLSLKFSVEMLEFIMDEKEFKKITKANRDKKLELFNEFWNPRDPTPETHKNELQAEYYRRVEVAMDEYTELSRPGFKTDRGEIYILYGEPKSITRNFPDQNVVIETWNYPNKTFRFRSSGGFDSFDLISQ
jgi:GWxTD domain-containing protein